MGQKTDTKNIFQIGKNNKTYIWDSKYLEEKKNESNIFIFQSIEIKKFIEKILKDNGLALYKFKINFLKSNIKIFISYIKLPKSQTIITQINNTQKLRLVKKNKIKNNYKKDLKEYLVTKNFLKNKINYKLTDNVLSKEIVDKQKIKIFLLNNIILNKQKNIYKQKFNLNYIFIKKALDKVRDGYKSNLEKQNKLKKVINELSINNKDQIKKRIKILQYYKYYIKIKDKKILKNIKINNFLENIIESLNIFTNNKFNITLNLQQVNKNLTFETSYRQLQSLKKTIIQLRQFKKSKFFKEGINTIFLAVIKKESAQLLANFLANQLKLVKRHGFFLKFVKKALSLMLTNKLVKATSIKMVIKGRFNGKSRAGKKTITINKHMPLMTINSKIYSAQSTAYGSNGTFGVKLWVNEKKINNVFTTKKI